LFWEQELAGIYIVLGIRLAEIVTYWGLCRSWACSEWGINVVVHIVQSVYNVHDNYFGVFPFQLIITYSRLKARQNLLHAGCTVYWEIFAVKKFMHEIFSRTK